MDWDVSCEEHMKTYTQHATAQQMPTREIITVACQTLTMTNVLIMSTKNSSRAAVQTLRRIRGTVVSEASKSPLTPRELDRATAPGRVRLQLPNHGAHMRLLILLVVLLVLVIWEEAAVPFREVRQDSPSSISHKGVDEQCEASCARSLVLIRVLAQLVRHDVADIQSRVEEEREPAHERHDLDLMGKYARDTALHPPCRYGGQAWVV
jgi:hypothetical protein